MGKAYCCDNCKECYPGDPKLTENGMDFCPNCVRVLEVFSKIDPFDIKRRSKNNDS